MNASISQLSSKQLRAAAEIKDKIDTLQAELNALLNISPSQTTGASSVSSGPRKMSAAGRARIAAAARARWAKIKGTTVSTSTSKGSSGPTKGGRTMSAAAKARISAAAKLRWKKAKAAGRNTL